MDEVTRKAVVRLKRFRDSWSSRDDVIDHVTGLTAGDIDRIIAYAERFVLIPRVERA